MNQIRFAWHSLDRAQAIKIISVRREDSSSDSVHQWRQPRLDLGVKTFTPLLRLWRRDLNVFKENCPNCLKFIIIQLLQGNSSQHSSLSVFRIIQHDSDYSVLDLQRQEQVIQRKSPLLGSNNWWRVDRDVASTLNVKEGHKWLCTIGYVSSHWSFVSNCSCLFHNFCNYPWSFSWSRWSWSGD